MKHEKYGVKVIKIKRLKNWNWCIFSIPGFSFGLEEKGIAEPEGFGKFLKSNVYFGPVPWRPAILIQDPRGPKIVKLWARSIQPKFPTGPTGKSGPPQKVDQFFRNFSGWTEPIHWVLDRNFRKFWLNGSRPLTVISLAFHLYKNSRLVV